MDSNGVVYTPPRLARHVLETTLAMITEVESPRLLDPACGEGEFLVEAYRHLLTRRASGACDFISRLAILRECVFGIDTDARAVEFARRRLGEIALECGSHGARGRLHDLEEILAANVRRGDALAEEAPLLRESFQVVVANPPFVGARRLARTERIGDSYGEAFSAVQGSCDLYVVFLERILDLLTKGGCYGVIVPNRIAAADYAARCRELLLAQTRLERIEDVSGLKAFPSAAVYPVILYGVKDHPGRRQFVRIARSESMNHLHVGQSWSVAQSAIDATRGFPLRPQVDLESRVTTRPLGELATLHSGTTGFAASRVAAALAEREQSEGEAWDFITTGSIDRYRIRMGNVRFLGSTYDRPVLPCGASVLTERKRRLFREPKIVIAGLSRRPEVAWSDGDLALGVQVFAAADCREDPFYLLAILNSKLFAHLFHTRFAGRRMAGGYLGITKKQLARLPIRTLGRDRRARQAQCELSASAQRLSDIIASGGNSESDPVVAVLERKIDALVYELYQLRDADIALLENDISE